MICSTTPKNVLFFSKISDVPENVWQDLGCLTNLYFSRAYLTSLEVSNPHIEFHYVVLLNDLKNPIAFSTLQIIDFDVDAIKNNLERFLRKLTDLARKIKILPKEKPLRFLVSGNVFVSGEHGIFIKNDVDKNVVIQELGKAIQHFANAYKRKEIAVFILKDFIKESLFITDELLDFNYYPIQVEPNMMLEILKDWHTFDDYLAALKTKFRVKARKAFKQSAELVVKDITLENIDELLPKMTTLYQKVVSKANFNFGEFNLDAYKGFIKDLNGNYILKAYYLEGKMVGFMSGLINGHILDAHFVGIDYQYNRRYAVYQRMLYDYIAIAIEQKLSVLNFARTASEIKSSVGAVPQNMTVYIRHKKSITNKLLKLFLMHIQPTKFNQKHPFKKL